ncbi:MAG: glutamine--tRNA ligase/YqeY domain fusion protein [Planctomycetota bacterium]
MASNDPKTNNPNANDAATETPQRHFIQQIIDEHIASGKWGEPGDRSVVQTRFPPEPNGYLHIGHAKSIWLNFSIAEEFGGSCNLRFDDTNPEKESDEYVRSIIDSVKWLGYAWPGMDGTGENHTAGVCFASDYFDRFYGWAVELIEKGLAYVDEQDPDAIRAQRGTLTEPGTPSPYRDRPLAESLELLEKMKSGGIEGGKMVLRAKIDMASPNMNLRDPVMYRVARTAHHRTGDAWSIYPMYDWAHGLEDSIEGITHSLCTLEFENHRPLYNWFIEAINKGRAEPIHHPQQIEFARLNVSYVVTSKRKLLELVEGSHVSGWDDPRMPTIAGIRRRGYTPESVRAFCAEGGVTKYDALVDYTRLENAVRHDLNKRAPRRMCVIDPIRVTITNWGDHGDPERLEDLDAPNNPESPEAGTRTVPFGRELYIERDDFMENAPKKFFRLAPGREVRLRAGYWITCNGVVKNDAGEIVELKCTYDPDTRGGESPPPDAEGKVRKVKGTLHWVAAKTAVDVEVRQFDRLYTIERPGKATGNHLDDLNPESLVTRTGCKLEPNWNVGQTERTAGTGVWSDGLDRFQFERIGYFCLDASGSADAPVFNRTVTLKDSWAKAAGKA